MSNVNGDTTNRAWETLSQPTQSKGPPNIPPSELWTKLTQMPRPSRTVPIPRMGEDGEPIGQLVIRVLTQEEQMICAIAAEKFAKEKLKEGKRDDLGYETIYTNQAVLETLFRACRRVEDPMLPVFPSAALLRANMTQDEISRLFEYYLSTQLELGPIIAQLSTEDMNGWIDAIAKGGLAASPFHLLSSEMQKLLAYTMACRIVSFATPTSSVGSQPEKTEKNLESEVVGPTSSEPRDDVEVETPPTDED